MLSRRAFLALSSAIATTPAWASLLPAGNHGAVYASAYSLNDKEHFFGLFNTQGALLWKAQLPERAHAPVVHPSNAIVGIVARRPGFYIDFFDMTSQQKITRLEPTKDHHFYGHALFTSDGKKLITQENHYPSGQGKTFIREWPSLKVLESYNSNGIGPHEAVFFNDEVLVIANGGQRTHPDNDRIVMNLETMQPNVTYMSLKDGSVINSFTHDDPNHHQLSIRHLDVNPDGLVALAFQYQGEIWEPVPLVALSHINSNKMEYLTIPEPVRIRFKQYCGSACFDSSGKVLAISTPRGGLVAYWEVESKTFLGIKNCRDVCGLAPSGKAHEFILTSGTGHIIRHNPVNDDAALLEKHEEKHWDNHLAQIIT
ncbi:DUF1513 domain-containing protein [Marinomonas sp. 2405UD66-6]|uniref:DUF1513 domain-containing protein n=1 Tax=Marinomonas sp. 2405UD66-6 TaxID=3391834 RepID=UPI0039C99023